MFLESKIKDLIKKYGKNKMDTGVSEVQISLLTYKINHLQKHFMQHKKDHCGRRGLLQMVAKRRKLLNYLKINNISRYFNIINDLSLRR
ncbi:30S ribosomal protein S15 [Buchnera aphidicola (Eriosoma lanigerum)]|uniref:30S ribosomal protein S15 n=1 Tax=Buchnera aphidicola TaxID=9 RepID=UPI003464074B